MSSERTGLDPAARKGTRNRVQVGSDVHFTVFIQVPGPRGDFVDPEPVDWNVSKDQALWRFLSQTSKGGEIDWRALAETYNVSLPFLLQQAAWLYEQQLSQVRAQMRKVASPQPAAPAPIPGSVSGSATVGGQSMRRLGSGEPGSRAASSLSRRSNETPVPRSERGMASTSVRPTAPPLSGPSLTTATYPSGRDDSTSSRQHPTSHHSHETTTSISDSRDHHQPATASVEKSEPRNELSANSPSANSDRLSSSTSSSSSSDSESVKTTSKSQAFQRRPHFSSARAPSHQVGDGEADSDEDEESPAFLPFPNPKPPPSIQDPSATLRIDTPTYPTQNRAATQPTKPPRSQTTHSSTSSGSSAAAAVTSAQGDGTPAQRPPGPLSPRRAAELSALSPRRRALAREGSDGTPSMGSSFSDLDDASVTQSALEEALLSNMQHGGGVASRMSSISQALKSRYL